MCIFAWIYACSRHVVIGTLQNCLPLSLHLLPSTPPLHTHIYITDTLIHALVVGPTCSYKESFHSFLYLHLLVYQFACNTPCSSLFSQSLLWQQPCLGVRCLCYGSASVLVPSWNACKRSSPSLAAAVHAIHVLSLLLLPVVAGVIIIIVIMFVVAVIIVVVLFIIFVYLHSHPICFLYCLAYPFHFIPCRAVRCYATSLAWLDLFSSR